MRRSGPSARILEGESLVEPEHEVHRLDGLAGAPFDEIVGHAEAGDGALAVGDVAGLDTDLGVIRALYRRHLGEPLLRDPHEGLRSERFRVEAANLLRARGFG